MQNEIKLPEVSPEIWNGWTEQERLLYKRFPFYAKSRGKDITKLKPCPSFRDTILSLDAKAV